MIAPGDVLHHRYRIEHSIGRGGMGEVFSAVVLLPPAGREEEPEVTLLRASPESERVAVKVVSRALVSDAAMARLAREATAASRIRSPFVPELIDVGMTPDGEVFLAMEILYGESLTARLKTRPYLHWNDIFLLGDDVLSGLIDAHDAGVVHRDLKPGNIFLCAPKPPDMLERAKILDFGVCKLDTPDDERLTGTGEAVGTVAYMAPEQIRGASHVTLRADLYSFGTVMFEALTGQLPHSGQGQMAMLASKLERNPKRLSDAARIVVPEGLEALLARLLARDPAARFGSAAEVRQVWRALGPAIVEPREGLQLGTIDAAPLVTHTGLASGTIEVAAPNASRVGFLLAAFAVGVSCIALLGLLGLVCVRRSEPTAAIESSPAPDPIVSASVVERPPAPFVEVPSNGVDLGEAGVLVGVNEDAVAPPPRVVTKNRGGPPRPTRVAPPTKPHIADKPRY